MDLVFETMSIGLYRSSAFLVMSEHPFLFTNKTVHPFYIDCSKLQDSPYYWDYATNNLGMLVESSVDVSRISRISGGESRDLLFSIPVAQMLDVPHVIIRKDIKTYGVAANIAGSINRGDYVVHVADLLTEATSARKWISEIEAHGATIDSYFVVFDRMQGGKENLAKQGVNVHSLAQMDDEFFGLGISEGRLTSELYKSIRNEYLQNPREWGLNYLRNNPKEIAHILQTDGIGLLAAGYPQNTEELLNLAKPNFGNFAKFSNVLAELEKQSRV